MISKTFAALVALSMLAASGPAAAQSSAAPAFQVGAPVDGSSSLEGRGPAFYLISAALLGLLVWGIIELTDDEDDFPTSP